MGISMNNRDPIYLQVVQYFKEQMAAGLLEPGQEIPSRRELANRLKINPNTVQRAYKKMEENGLIHTDRNSPSKITKDKSVLKAVKDELILKAVNNFVYSIHSIHVPIEDVLQLVKEKYAEKAAANEEDPE